MWLQFMRSGKAWSGASAIATCLGAWADRDSVPDMSTAIVPILVWLIPKVAIGGMVLAGGMLTTAGVRWVLDRLRDGPSVREFQSLSQHAQQCISSLIAYYDAPPREGNGLGTSTRSMWTSAC